MKRGKRLPIRPCRCGRMVPLRRHRVETLRFVNAPLFRVTSLVE